MLKVQEIREIIKLIDQSSINEFTYETNGTKIELKKESNQDKLIFQPQYEQTEQVTEAVNTQVEAQPVQTSDEQKASEEPLSQIAYDKEIVSPMVGTFYRKSSPENDPYVEKGSEITVDTVVCVVEAMKLFNEIESEIAGEIVEILVEDGELVEYGQPLFRVKN